MLMLAVLSTFTSILLCAHQSESKSRASTIFFLIILILLLNRRWRYHRQSKGNLKRSLIMIKKRLSERTGSWGMPAHRGRGGYTCHRLAHAEPDHSGYLWTTLEQSLLPQFSPLYATTKYHGHQIKSIAEISKKSCYFIFLINIVVRMLSYID